ncbi:TSCPD domain-containing protein [Desulforhopalus singaporensis]|uniref:ribonucleoside-diphosphate reductase n=1 Tax=Desulforhopalus singaporensis TaxID=91360 RepID=A0A1H0NFD0_9BACT|nr:hypothetical protein [Desulforhopalus singaporensis]SDO91477.1 hypothetical protein SAMN05660330_01377 [Desulforhopalus singaporensis]
MYQTDRACDICKKKKKLLPVKGNNICAACNSVIQAVKESPELLRNLADLADHHQPGPALLDGYSDPELPDVLDGVRYRTTDRDRNTWYVSVSEIDGNPVEIFASTAFENDRHLQSRISNLTTITRLISLILRHIFMGEKLTLEKTLTQLKRSSRQPNDLPEMLSRILHNYRREKAAGDKVKETIIP